MPAPDADFAAQIASLCPGFVAGAPLRARKSRVLAGTLDGRAVVAKQRNPDRVWRWYFANEVAVYRAGLPYAPQLIAASDDVLVVADAGAPLATRRRPHADVDLRRFLALRDALADLALPVPPPAPSALRHRLLEDPSDPRWIHDGLVGRGYPQLADAIPDDLATCHGDLLLRNVCTDAVVDWECAGRHPRDWDLGLLYTQLSHASRADLLRLAGRSILPLAAWALIRELKFARTPDAALRAELAAILAT